MRFYYDLHLHSCLSPCGDCDMTPNNLVHMAMLNGMQLIALTDHNSCQNCQAAQEVGRQVGVTVVAGMELCTSEEAHVVCLFPSVEAAQKWEAYVQRHSVSIPNRPQIFGDQIVMNEHDQEIGRVEHMLINATQISVNQVFGLVKEYGGAAFPAHIDRDSYSVLSSLGDIPPEAGFCAAEITSQGDVEALKKRHPILRNMILFEDSDAHYLEHMPASRAWIELPEASPISCLIEVINGNDQTKWSRG